MSINTSSIMSKIEAWSKTDAGKRRMKEVIDRYQKEGRKATAAGSTMLTADTMYKAAGKLIETLRSTAIDMGLPDSVLEHFDSLEPSAPFKMPDGSTTMYIYFHDDLHRDSLQPNKYAGADNIIAVLNNGYEKHENIAKVWGVWHDMKIHGLTERTGLQFMQKAVSVFNGRYGSMYHATAEVGPEYN